MRHSVWLLFLLLLLPAYAKEVRSISRVAGSVFFKLDDGIADITFNTPSGLRFRNYPTDRFISPPEQPAERVEFAVIESESVVRLISRGLIVEVEKRPFKTSFFASNSEPLLSNGVIDQIPSGMTSITFLAGKDNRFYGLGARNDAVLNLRGKIVESTKPFLVSSSGYGLYLPLLPKARFDLGSGNPEQIKVLQSEPLVDFCFYAGSGIKDVFDQHHLMQPRELEYQRRDVMPLPAEERPQYAQLVSGHPTSVLPQILHQSLSGIPVPAVDATILLKQPNASRRRFEDLFSLMPVLLVPKDLNLSESTVAFRRSLEPHLITYLQEVKDRGFPVIHPLPFQFPTDPKAASISDEFMLGDELLVAPLLFSSRRRTVYFPQGNWTDLRSNHIHRGRRYESIRSTGGEIPLFVRNGSILPLARNEGIDLHYFPKLGAEYFIYEPEISQISQIHAGPAADILRLQIESAIKRNYEWVIHNVIEPASIEVGTIRYTRAESQASLSAGQWFYDGTRKNLHIRAAVQSGEDLIVNVMFPQNEWFDFR